MADDWSKFPVAGSAKEDEWASFPAAGEKPEDPIRQRARKELQEKGLLDRGNLANMADLGRKGMTLGFNDEIAAAALTPIEMIRQGTLNPAEAYRYAKAREDILQEEARKQTGAAGLAAEVLGGAATGGILARGGLSLMKPNQAILPRIGAGISEGALYGATSGAGDAKSLAETPGEMLKGAGIGGATGGAITAAAPLVNALARNTIGWASASMNPQGFANRQVARAITESGMTPQQIAQAVAEGQAAGQPFVVADAMGNAGQRMLSTVARAPGEGRTATVKFLEGRQADQGRRIANALAEALDAPTTAAQTRAAMEAQRGAQAATNYGASRAQAGAIDVSPAIQKADDFLQPGATRFLNPGNNIADDSVEAAVRRARAYLTDGRSQISDFQMGLRAKMELDNMIDNARGTVQRQLIPIRNALDDALAAASPPYANARNTFRQQSQAIEAIDQGRAAATRGRTEDTIPAFGRLSPEGQQGWRVGYADPLIGTIQGAEVGVNKARPFTSPAMMQELPAFAVPGRDQPLMERLGRETTMFETRAQALGGSKTADNLADAGAAGVDPVSVIGNALNGNYLTAARNLVGRSSGALSGNTPKVREALSKALLSGDGAALDTMLTKIAKDDETRRRILASYISGTLAGTGQGQSSARR